MALHSIAILFYLMFLQLVVCGAFSKERLLAENATPLKESASVEEAAQQMLQQGVTRLNGVISKEDCHELKKKILAFRDDNDSTLTDMRNIPNTRIRFSEPIVVPLNQRADVLLPIEDDFINKVLQELIDKLAPVLETAAAILPNPNGDDVKEQNNIELQLVEAASLVSEYGATDQTLHPDFRRDATKKETRLPPRLVTFLYLQDTPTIDHGPTIFLPTTNNPESHNSFYEKQQHNQQQNNNDAVAVVDSSSSLARCATLNTGDVAIYDASVLHFGSANRVPENTRAVFYFGISLLLRDGDAGMLETTEGSSSMINLDPIVVEQQGTNQGRRTRFVHDSVRGMSK